LTDAQIVSRKIPRTGEDISAIGLGTFMTFDLIPGGKRDDLAEVVRRFWAAGGRVIDTSPLYRMAEVNVGQFASMLNIMTGSLSRTRFGRPETILVMKAMQFAAWSYPGKDCGARRLT
jgi:diketogulonate reductase-like aldo/keto reductase